MWNAIVRTARWGSCIAALLAVQTQVDPQRHASGQEWGHLGGQVIVDGSVPAPQRLVVTQDQAFCGRHDLFDESLQVGDDGGLANVFVFLLQSRRERQDPPIHPSYEGFGEDPLVLDNLKCRFEPHTLLMRTSQPLIVKNSDEIGHNANFESRDNGQNPQIPAGREFPVSLDVAERGPIKVSCGSHGWMSAYLLVRDEPYVAITGDDGRFSIENLPAGEWTFQFWHERVGFLDSLAQGGREVAGRRGELTVTIRDGQTTDLGVMTVAVDELAYD